MIKKSLEGSIILSILDLANQLKQRGDLLCQQLGITTQQWLILLHLAPDPNLPGVEDLSSERKILGSDLATTLNVSRPNITNLINALLQKGLVSQEEDEHDRRRKLLMLTEKGKELLMRLEPFRIISNQGLLDHASEEEKAMVLTFIQQTAKYLNDMPQAIRV